MSEYTAWVIECPQDDDEPVCWWNVSAGWMRDPNDATHFCRKEDAMAFRSTYPGFRYFHAVKERKFVLATSSKTDVSPPATSHRDHDA